MVDISKGTVVLIFIISLFLILDFMLIFMLIEQYNILNVCKNKQNVHCPPIMCNGDPGNDYKIPNSQLMIDKGLSVNNINPNNCWPYAFRDVRDDTGKLLEIQCSYPFPQKTAFNIKGK